jgi:hypothetical protein
MDGNNLSTTPTREAKTKEVREFAESMREHMVAAIAAGGDTDRKVASMLNRQKLRTRTGKRWTLGGVKYLRMLPEVPRQSPKQLVKNPVKAEIGCVGEALRKPADCPTADL